MTHGVRHAVHHTPLSLSFAAAYKACLACLYDSQSAERALTAADIHADVHVCSKALCS